MAIAPLTKTNKSQQSAGKISLGSHCIMHEQGVFVVLMERWPTGALASPSHLPEPKAPTTNQPTTPNQHNPPDPTKPNQTDFPTKPTRPRKPRQTDQSNQANPTCHTPPTQTNQLTNSPANQTTQRETNNRCETRKAFGNHERVNRFEQKTAKGTPSIGSINPRRHGHRTFQLVKYCRVGVQPNNQRPCCWQVPVEIRHSNDRFNQWKGSTA